MPIPHKQTAVVTATTELGDATTWNPPAGTIFLDLDSLSLRVADGSTPGGVVVGGGGIVPLASSTTPINSAGYLGLPQNGQDGSAYTIQFRDLGRQIYGTSGGTMDIVIPVNSLVEFPIGSTVMLITNDSTTMNINTDDTLLQAGTGSSGGRTLGHLGMATLVKIEPTVWLISGVGLA